MDILKQNPMAVGYVVSGFLAGLIAARVVWPSQTVSHRGLDADDDDDENFGGDALRNDFGVRDGPGKMVLVVNQELKMGKGKIAAQCGHAVLGAYKRAKGSAPSALKWWERLGQAKICVQCPTEAEMDGIHAEARKRGLVTYMVSDAGRTQIPAGSRTVLAVGPAPDSMFKGLTDHLKLL